MSQGSLRCYKFPRVILFWKKKATCRVASVGKICHNHGRRWREGLFSRLQGGGIRLLSNIAAERMSSPSKNIRGMGKVSKEAGDEEKGLSIRREGRAYSPRQPSGSGKDRLRRCLRKEHIARKETVGTEPKKGTPSCFLLLRGPGASTREGTGRRHPGEDAKLLKKHFHRRESKQLRDGRE